MELIVLLIVLAVFGFVAWEAISGIKPVIRPPVRKGRTARPSPGPVLQEFHWEGTGDFEFEIVGESHYQETLARLAGERGTQSVERRYKAKLVLEDHNLHDPKAVAVRIDNETVGYLSREDARSYRRRLGQKRLSGINATCDAIIVGGGTRRDGERLFYGVKLDMKPFE